MADNVQGLEPFCVPFIKLDQARHSSHVLRDAVKGRMG